MAPVSSAVNTSPKAIGVALSALSEPQRSNEHHFGRGLECRFTRRVLAEHAEKTGAAVQELMNELESLKKEGPNAEELALAKESLRLALPGRFESTVEVGNAVADRERQFPVIRAFGTAGTRLSAKGA